MNKASVIIIFLMICISGVKCQLAEPGFAKYLKESGNFGDLILIDNLDKSNLTIRELDSLNFYLAWAYYNIQELDESIKKFSEVGKSSSFYNTANYFAAWSRLYLGEPKLAIHNLKAIKPATPREDELRSLLNVGSMLMQRDLVRSDSLITKALESGAFYSPQWERMEFHNKRLNDFKPKSHFVAGLLSGIIPGSGKIYTGQKGGGVSSFLTLGALAGITIENGLKTGWKRWNTLAAASIFSVFYLGNIYGSIVGVRVYRERFFNEVDRAILLDINIPLRDIYR